MKTSGKFLFLIVSLISNASLLAQSTLSVYASAVFVSTPVGGHHIDEFSVTSLKPIQSLDALVHISPMNQIQVDGQPTVFPSLLPVNLLTSDSHFVFDTSSATILSQSENTSEIQASVLFNANFPTNFKLAQIVGANGHDPYIARISGKYVDGQSFSASVAFVPEPSVWMLMAAGAMGLAGCRRKA
jgi:hypothetical protein